MLVSRELNAISSGDCHRTRSRIQTQSAQRQFLGCRLSHVDVAHICCRGIERKVSGDDDIVSKDTLLLHQLCTQAGCCQGTRQVVVGVVSLCTLVEQGCIALIVRTIALIEILRGSGHIDERYA